MSEVRAVYEVAELARLAGVTRQTMHRILDRLDVSTVPGRPTFVFLAALRRAAPDLWDSIVEVQGVGGLPHVPEDDDRG